MDKLVTLAVFDSVIDVDYNLLKDMLDQAGIKYVVNNEYSNYARPMFTIAPANLCIDLKVYEKDMKPALEILNSIKR